MARLVTIEVTGQAGRYEAMVRGIQDQHRRLYNEAQAGAGQAATQMRVWETQLKGIGTAVTSLVSAFGAMRALNFIDQFTSLAEQLLAVSRRTGVAVEDLDALRRVAQQNEAEFEELTTGLSFLQRSLALTADASSKQAQMLKALGVTSRDPLQAFLQLSDAMRENLDENNSLLAARELLGRSSINLVNFMRQGSEAIREQMEAIKELGVITTETATAADQFRDAWAEVREQLALPIGTAAMRFFIDLVDRLKATMDQLGRLKQYFSTGEGSFPTFTESLEAQRAGRGLNALQASTLRALDDQARLSSNKINIAALEDQAKAAKRAQEAAENFTKKLKEQNEQLSLQIVGLTDGEQAVDEWKIKLIEAEAATLKLNTAQLAQVENYKNLILGVRQLKEEEEKRKIITQQLIALDEAMAKNQENEIKQIQDLVAARLEYNQRTREQQTELIRARGGTEQQVLTQQLENIRAQMQEIEGLRADEKKEHLARLQELGREQQIVEARLQRLGTISIDIGRAIGDTMADIAEGLATGTLKGFDIVKTAGSSALRLITDIFRQTLQQKLSFEFQLFNNVKQIPGQMQNALNSGGGSQGLWQSILFGSGGGALGPGTTISMPGPGQGFPVPPLLGGTGGTGSAGIFGFLSQILKTPIGIGTSTIGSIGTAGLGGYLFGRLLGLNTGGQIGSTIGSIGGSIFAGTTLGSTLGTAAGSAVGGWLGGGAAGTAIGSMVGTYIFPVIGTIIGAIIGSLVSAFTGKKNPTAVIGAQFSGINYNQAAGQFDIGDIAVFVRRTADLSGRRAYQVANEVENILTPLAAQWTEMLNLFPSVIREQMIPALDETNRILNDSFRRLKFSEGGSRNIAQELAALGGPANVAFVSAFRAPISVGFAKSLERAGFAGQELNYSNLANLAPAGAEFLAKELTNLATTFGTLGGISPRGITQFLSGLDIGNIQSLLDQFYAISDVLKIPFAIQDLIPQLQPFIDYLSSAVQESSNLFGRGLIAAMEAATESDARLAFMNSLGTGIKDRVFQGLTEAFIASAEFTDLLAPIQQQIRAFTEEAILTGNVPDIARFRQAILPAIEQITTRAELLEPLIDALQELGFDIREMLGLLPEAAEPPPPAPPAVVNISINTNNPDEIGRKIGEILGGKLPPPVF